MNVGLHYNCRNNEYPSKTESVIRLNVPDDKVGWDVQWEDYCPPYYTAKHILNQSWADPEIGQDTIFKPIWNHLDGNVNRNSHMGAYMIKDGYPLNPWGRTGLFGRGILGRWGPNHAADPIVTRWKRTNGIIIMGNTNRPILQFIAIKRRDCNEWAIPGGMVDPGEVVTTLKREFQEEALNSLEMSSVEKSKVENDLSQFFSTGETVYKGYVDDRRNTDNAWMETVAQNFHDENDLFVGSLNLSAGDDAIGVTWIDLSSDIQLYASHSQFLKIVAEKRAAHW